MSVEIRRSSDRFPTRAPGRDTRHSFSFGEHYDPDRLGFGPMVCHDDHRLVGGAGFADHAHRDLEIVTWVLSGSLTHADSGADSGGDPHVVEPGTVQVLWAGAGVVHSEIGTPGAGITRFIQVWLKPDEVEADRAEPSRHTASLPLAPGVLVPVASGHDPSAAVGLRTSSATFWVADLAAGQSVSLPADRLQHVFVARGALVRSSLAAPLEAGDSFLITDDPGLELTAAVPTELLVWTFR